MENKTFYLLLFHGSARNDALISAQAFLDKINFSRQIKNTGIAFLRGQQPDLASALKKIAQDNFNKVKVIQLFLLPGAHVNEDIPGMINSFKKDYPNITVETSPCLVELKEFQQMINGLTKDND
jgi:sirohydrochlorin ferrochelatase